MSKKILTLALLLLSSFAVSAHASTPPSAGSITAPTEAVMVNTNVDVSADFTDEDEADAHTALWEWGNGMSTWGAVTDAPGSKFATGSFSYMAAGIHRITLTVNDSENQSDQTQFRYLVAYDPAAGGLMGAGSVTSPAGAYTADPRAAGTFTISQIYAKYGYDRTLSSRQNVFKFFYSPGRFSFNSTKIYWLALSGNKAWMKGEGLNNVGAPCYFLVSVVESRTMADRVRVKIWRKADGVVLYDNQKDSTGSSDPDDALAVRAATTGPGTISFIR